MQPKIEPMPQVFLSYAHEDIDTARKICNDLTAQGVEVWLDENEIRVGQNWRNEITKAIRESDYFMALLSSNSLTKKGFVQKEMKMAWDILDEYPQDQIYFLPVRLDECQPQDERLRDLHYADLASDYEAGIQNLLRVMVPDENETSPPAPDQVGEQKDTNQEVSPGANFKIIAGLAVIVGIVVFTAYLMYKNNSFSLFDVSTTTTTSKPTTTTSEPTTTTSEPTTTTSTPSTTTSIPTPQPNVRLRDKPTVLNENNVKAMLKKHNFFDSSWNKSGDFKNAFKDNGNGTVSDHATGLMWQQSGSDEYMKYKEAPAYVQKLNQERFAGYDDWRLPTLEELASLLESEKRSDGLYIDPIFDNRQRYCWTADTKEGSSELAWVVYFDDGDVVSSFLIYEILKYYVRVVRAGQ